MSRTILIALFCSLFVLGESRGQDVFVPRQLKQLPVTKPEVEPSAETPPTKPAPAKEAAATNHESTTKFEPVRAMPKKETASRPPANKTEPAKPPATKEAVVSSSLEKPAAAKTGPAKPSTTKETASKSELDKTHPTKTESTKTESTKTVATKEPEEKPAKSSKSPGTKADSPKVAKEESATKSEEEKPKVAKTEPKKPNPEKPSASKESAEKSDQEKPRVAKTESSKSNSEKENPTAAREPASKSKNEKAGVAKAESTKSNDEKAAAVKTEPIVHVPSESTRVAKLEAVKPPDAREPAVDVQQMDGPVETASTKLADGFDFPVGKPDADGYYRARGFRSGGHMGEDWDGVRGGDTDLRDPIYCVGDGVVVFARDVHLGWGNVIIVRHAFREDGTIKHIDSLYGHLNSILVKRGQRVARGQQIGTMGTAHGQYDAHLHLEIRKNLEIGMSKSKFQKDLSNYHDPSKFITSHRHIAGGGATFRVAMNTFTHDGEFHFDSAPNFGTRKRSTSQSSAALRRALSNGNSSQHE